LHRAAHHPEHMLLQLLAMATLGAISGCSYSSTYVPPEDGRARLIWTGREAGEQLPEVSAECMERVDAAISERASAPRIAQPWWEPPADPESESGEVSLDQGATLDVGGSSFPGRHLGHLHAGPDDARGGGLRPASPTVGHLGSAQGGTSGGSHGGGVHGGGVHGGGSHGGGGGGGGGGGMGAGAVALVALAYLLLPTVAIVWAEDRPEQSGVARAVERVHAYNDLVRAGDPSCGRAP